MRLEDKVAVITGAASGIGKAIAERFAAEGAAVVVADVNRDDAEQTAAQISKDGRRAFALAVDVRVPQAVEAMIDQTIATYEKLDVLVNSAAIARVAPVLEIDFETWNDVIAVNLTGTFLCAQAAARRMVQANSGRIINLSSVNGQRAITGRGAYTAAKGGVEMITRIMAAELGGHGITVNAIAPGPVDTPMVMKMHTRSTRQDWYRVLPIKRYARPEEVASAALFLASDEAAYISGHTLNVDGGFDATGLLLDSQS